MDRTCGLTDVDDPFDRRWTRIRGKPAGRSSDSTSPDDRPRLVDALVQSKADARTVGCTRAKRTVRAERPAAAPDTARVSRRRATRSSSVVAHLPMKLPLAMD